MTLSEQLFALRQNAGFVPLNADAGADMPGAGWVSVTGADRVRWLNGMVTNSVQALTPGDGAYSFLLNAQGRIQADCTVWAEAERLLLQTSSSQAEPLLALLDRYIIMDDVELADESAAMDGLLVAGQQAAEKLAAIGIPARASRLLKRQAVEWQGHTLSLLTAYGPLVPRFELWSPDAEVIAAAREALLAQHVAECSLDALELLRVLEGTPRFGVDIRERELPQETGQMRALHFAKGCYLGQEIVERIRSRGNVHRTFARFRLAGDNPSPGAALEADGKPVGELTTLAAEEIDGERLALGFVRREALERGLLLQYPGGEASPLAAGAFPALAASE